MGERRSFPWPSFSGRHDPTRRNAVAPNLTLTPGDSEREYRSWLRLVHWHIERAAFLGKATWADHGWEACCRQRDRIALRAWLTSARAAAEYGRRLWAIAAGEAAEVPRG